MAIQILGLRPYYSEKYKKKKLSEEWFHFKYDSIAELFWNARDVGESLTEASRYNLFYTMAHTKHQDRKEFIHADVIAFDIDYISTEEKEAYLEPLSVALKVDLRKCIVVWTGNGVQVLIKLKESVTRDFFSKKAAYKYWIDRIDKSLAESGLPGNADPSIFDPTRVLRLPYTKNIKPMEEPESGTVREATLWNSHLEYCGWELGEAEPQEKEKSLGKMDKDFGPVDVKSVMKECLFLNYVENNQETVIEPIWRAGLGLTSFFKDGDKSSHQISSRHPQYTHEDTQSQVDRIRTETSGPRLCKGIDSLWGGCKDCKWNGKIKTPLQIKSAEFFLDELSFDPTAKPTEMQIVAKLLKNYQIHYNIRENFVDDTESTLVQYAGELFLFNGKIWKVLDEAAENVISQLIHKLYNFKATSSKVESTFKTFKKFVPHPPADKNFFEPTSFMSNFQNGTLSLKEDEAGTYSLDFKEHSKFDYLTNIIPGDYDPTFTQLNPEFSEMLEKMFAGDIDKDEKIRTLAQMFGAALMPAFPHLFFLHGVAGGGKSTICTILHNLLERENICGVQPHEFEGFNLESMAGKLVNMVTDVSSRHTIGDDVVKQIEDRMPFRIRRKNKKDLYAPLPSIHIFGANDLPKNFDGASRAHDRRWSLIPFNNSITHGNQEYRRDFGNYVFKKNPQGILNFAIKGLIDLINCKGHYLNPASGKAALNEWQTDNDILAQFIDSFGEGCLSELSLHEEGLMYRTDLWNYFFDWRDETGRKFSKMTNSAFYKLLEGKGFNQKKINGKRMITGITMGKREVPENVREIRF